MSSCFPSSTIPVVEYCCGSVVGGGGGGGSSRE